MNLMHFVVLGVVALMAGVSSVVLQADTLVVSDAAGFDAALAAAQPDDQILMNPGLYLGGFFQQNLTGVTIRSVDPGNPAVIQASGHTNGLQLVDAVDVTLEDLVIENASGNGLNIDDGGSFASPSRNITLRNLEVRDIGGSGNNDGIKLSGVVGFHIDSVRVTNWGQGGSAVDMVGSHHGLIENSFFGHASISGGGSGVRPKGGSKFVTIRANRFELADGRPIQFGGSTGSQFFRFIDGDSGYEADEIIAEGNVVVGGVAAVSYSVIDGGIFHHNLAVEPSNWVLRILNENEPLATDTQNGQFHDNVIITDQGLSRAVNVGPNTLPETFGFVGNQWYNRDQPQLSTPDLPSTEVDGIYGVDPAVDPGITADRAISWSFDWGRWLVNTLDVQDVVALSNPESFLLATANDGGEFDPLQANPLIGDWSLAVITDDTLALAAHSQAVLINLTTSGDANLDGIVDVADLGILAANFNLSDQSFDTGDFNGDGSTDVADLGILGANWTAGQALTFTQALQSSPLAARVPEPTTLVLWIASLAGVVRRRPSGHAPRSAS